MSQDYIPLANITLGSSASSVSFSNIPATPYRDLILVFDGTGTGGANGLTAQVNNDTAANYPWVRAGGNGSSTFSSTGSSAIPMIFSNDALTTTKSNSIVQFLDYSATDKQKTVLVRENNNSSGPSVVMYAARWANTNAINSIRITIAANSIAIGSTLSLYGIVG